MPNRPGPYAPMSAVPCDFCRGDSSTRGVRVVEITLRWQRHVATIWLCEPCYDLFRARMKETAIEVARQGWTQIPSSLRCWLATQCLRAAAWLIAPRVVPF